MKKYFLLSFFLSCSLFGMEHDAKVTTYFLPENQSIVFDKLMQFLDSACQKVYVAMYELTDQRVVDKLVALRRRRVHVQLVLDDSGIAKQNDNSIIALKKLLRNNITTIIDLSETFQAGIMHNKYVIVDGNQVWTGSANFTYPVLSEHGKRQNDENIVIMRSAEIAQLYEHSFRALKTAILKSHIQIIAKKEQSDLASWLIDAINRLYAKSPEFKALVSSEFSTYIREENNRLVQFFPDLKVNLKRQASSELVRPISDYQRKEIEKHYPEMDTREMSYDEAYGIVGKIRSGTVIQPTVYEAPSSSSKEEAASQPQINLLIRLGVQNISNLTKSQASALITKNMGR